jgi:uncharacterized protein (DUF488 family)
VPTLHTIGHGARPLAELVAALSHFGVTTIIDVRRFPGSRRHPHFGRAALERSLGDARFSYEWWGDELGGRRKPAAGASRHAALRVQAFRNFADYMDTESFQIALRDVVREAEQRPGVTLMCAETLWWRCHRRLIADAITLGGATISHILDVGNAQPHRLHPAVRADELGRPTYDVGATSPLL